MFSLPAIKEMNERASKSAKSLLKAVKTKKLGKTSLTCEHSDHGCQGELRVYPWYDIFSADPKGVITLCEKHDGYYGSPDEGYFECGDCGKVYIENYTWENYYNDDEDGRICLNCYAKRVLADEGHPAWCKTDGSEEITFERIRLAPHIIAVQGPTHGLEFLGNTEFDSMSGECISGGGESEIENLLKEAAAKGYGRALLVLDAAYQFAVLIGVYVNPSERN
jgi:hypothetical protein